MKAFLSRAFAYIVCRSVRHDGRKAGTIQMQLLRSLTGKAKDTAFGRDHAFGDIRTYNDFREKVPVRDYEGLKAYFERVKSGEEDVLWKGRPIYLSKTSGTTSGAKYIPITADSISNHINSARNALLFYINGSGNTSFVNGKMIFLQGNPLLAEVNGIKTGRLSGIVAHHVPSYLQSNRLPSFPTNCIEDWEEKVDAIVEETRNSDMRLVSGIPPWLMMYFEKLLKASGKRSVSEVFPSLSLLVHGGVNFRPYAARLEELIGRKIDQIELYPASEGFLAYQDSMSEEGLLLNVNSGIFFEFIKADEIESDKRRRISLGEVETGVNYAIVLSSNAGLWAYLLGDTVKFLSLDPHRITVTGRISHFTSAFGEHVIAEEVEEAARYAAEKTGMILAEFHVAPLVNAQPGSKPCHEWFVEFGNDTDATAGLAPVIDGFMQERNPYYRDLRKGNILSELRITTVRHNGFNDYMKSIGKLGGQNKLPRLSNNRQVADGLRPFLKTV